VSRNRDPRDGGLTVSGDRVDEPYLQALQRGRLLLQTCRSCGRAQFYPRTLCHRCGSRSLEWSEHSGRGTVLAFTVVHRASDPAWARRVPYILALVRVSDDVQLLANVQAEPGTVSIGTEVAFARDRAGASLTGPLVVPIATAD
jgi:uncharacterized protein